MTRRHLDCKICRRRLLEDDVLLQTGAAYVTTERINSLYRVIILQHSRLLLSRNMKPCWPAICYGQSLFYLTTAVHVSGVTITHLQEHKRTVTTASGNRYTVLLPAAIVEGLELYTTILLRRTDPWTLNINVTDVSVKLVVFLKEVD